MKHFARNHSGEVEPVAPIAVGADQWLMMQGKTLVAAITFAGAVITGWMLLNHTVSELETRQSIMDQKLSDQHDTLLLLGQTVSGMDKKLDYLTGTSRIRPPASQLFSSAP